jgi:hypothetical protein
MREKLEALWQAVYPSAKFFDQWQRFDELLDAEAWLDAAMMLVPEGWLWSIKQLWDEPPVQASYVFINTYVPSGQGGLIHTGEFNALAPTPAEALLAAIEKARTV